ncbi:MAG: hypothetical protein HC880_20640 [Bacteroidia bacterium]|nr:hypothetical protein [Bacteroidia bacterium]
MLINGSLLRSKLIFNALIFWLFVLNIACNTHSDQKQTPGFMENSMSNFSNSASHPCFEIKLGIPEGAVFFMAEVSAGLEAEANKRWAILEDGTVLYSHNDASYYQDELPPEEVFNQNWQAKPIVQLPKEAVINFIAQIESEGFFHLPSRGSAKVEIEDGMYSYLYAKTDKYENCVKFEPEASLSKTLKAYFEESLKKHLTNRDK